VLITKALQYYGVGPEECERQTSGIMATALIVENAQKFDTQDRLTVLKGYSDYYKNKKKKHLP
jgi:hypothetical protein